MALNYRLKAARVLKGLTQLQLAEKLGMVEHDIYRLETGRTQADPELKERMAAVLQKPTFEMFDA